MVCSRVSKMTVLYQVVVTSGRESTSVLWEKLQYERQASHGHAFQKLTSLEWEVHYLIHGRSSLLDVTIQYFFFIFAPIPAGACHDTWNVPSECTGDTLPLVTPRHDDASASARSSPITAPKGLPHGGVSSLFRCVFRFFSS